MPNCPQPIPFAEPWEYELRFPRDPRAPGIARAALRAMLAAHGLPDLIPQAELLASELATNSVRHSEDFAAMQVSWSVPVLRVSVWDTSPQPPTPLTPPADADSGRGLLILDALADRWGGVAMGERPFGCGGKAVWFELAWDGRASAAVA